MAMSYEFIRGDMPKRIAILEKDVARLTETLDRLMAVLSPPDKEP